jgi:alkylhydroperoxidase/carboxymuconolactone decarboxylase family protein YurZ
MERPAAGNTGPVTFLPRSADRLRELFQRLDPAFAAVWEDHISRLLHRTQLDARIRFLILTSQYTVTGRHDQLEENLEAALAAGVPTQELLEAILQTFVYAGPWTVEQACDHYQRVLGRTSPPAPGPEAPDLEPRDLEAERSSWSPSDAADPRLPRLLDRYGWHAISNGLRLRPNHHLNMVDTLDALDPDFLQTWLDTVYQGMYGRGILDDRTRLLCVVGATLALGESHQSRRHMRAALRTGATPRQVLEVIFHTTAFFGHPYVMPAAFDDLLLILDDEDRIGELVDTDRIESVRQIVAARVARRGSVADSLEQSRSSDDRGQFPLE